MDMVEGMDAAQRFADRLLARMNDDLADVIARLPALEAALGAAPGMDAAVTDATKVAGALALLTQRLDVAEAAGVPARTLAPLRLQAQAVALRQTVTLLAEEESYDD